jgi:hypothetical protein
MDGLLEIFPGYVPIEIEGRDWQLGPLRLIEYAEIERRFLRNRRSPIEAACAAIQGQSEQARKDIFGMAFDEEHRGARATREELQDWVRSGEGILFEFWLRLRGRQPDMTLASVEELFANRTVEISRKMASAAQATGEYPLGNLPSRGRKSRDPAAANRFPGAAFSAA